MAGAEITIPPVVDEDEKRLNELGYKQEYRRVMTPFEQWAYTFSYTAPLGFVTGYYGFMYSYGGPVTIIWGFIATAIGTLCMAFAMAEVCSAFPTLGSVYYWVARLVPQQHAPWLSWFVGWLYLVGSFCGTALNEYLLAQLISTMILLGTGKQLSSTQIVAVTAGVFFIHFWVSIVNTRWLGRLSAAGAWFQIMSILGIVITLLAVAPKYQHPKFVFTQFVNAPGQGVKSKALVVLLGLPYFQSILTGFEVGSHVVEEVKTAATSGPRAMIRTVYVTASVEIVLLLVLTFCIQIPDNVLGDNTATGGGDSSAASQIYYDVFHARYGHGVAGSIVFTGLAVVSLFFGNITNVTLTARMAYAMARDQGLPFHRHLIRLSKKEKIPVLATVVAVVGSFICTLPALGSSVAFTAITAMSTITAYGPYTVVLIVRHLYNDQFERGPFYLGKYGIFVGSWGAFWGACMCVFFCFPPTYPVTATTLNYAPVSVAGCIAIGLIYWFTSGRTSFHGPSRSKELHNEAKLSTLPMVAHPGSSNRAGGRHII
ncbi:choline transport protein [Marchantia polymorpha subsp. ruderalis]|uniref:Amino acid permease/ SLC12A domain-containing protein n=2 Tax=Marchantia polymorpha TaxID=3197 RepID=A0A176WGZ8_MARPO|nr:hypothetical protein AXG93_2294s1300 [Marchantia polymorpha subsp. ruderalis]PTQ31079.1 hypothetical protein MARPO_0115s0006 [Marchantia polymorpha]BBN07974.1 hypothetical protein Mp_4g07740 [Marchantia polymorpha subsp. ruderalis]|eukprot:PTQ31079.1 hypothetical protein MARPO_0115s0006 [Marchantia polymorpha]